MSFCGGHFEFCWVIFLLQIDWISRMSFSAAILNCNFRLQTSNFRLQISEVPTELFHLEIDTYLFVKWNRIQSAQYTHRRVSLLT